MDTTSVIVVDDHALVRESIVRIVNSVSDMEVVGEAGDVPNAEALVDKLNPDIVCLDIGLGPDDGLEFAAKLKRRRPPPRIVVLSMHDGQSYLRRALALEVDAYVHKSSPSTELTRALEAVRDGGAYVDGSLTKRALDIASGRATGSGADLTDRELEILVLLARGQRPPEIADTLFLSVKTVKNHLTNVYSKLDVETGAQAVAEAYRLGIVEPS